MSILRTSSVAGVLMVGAMMASRLYASPSLVSAPSLDAPAAVDAESMSPAALQAEAEQMQLRVRSHVQRGHQLERTAAAEKDAFKLSCIRENAVVNERLLELATTSVGAMRTAVHSNDRAQQLAQFRRVAQAAEICDDTTAGLEACAGAKQVTTTTSARVTVIGPKIKYDPTDDCNTLGLAGCEHERLAFGSEDSPADIEYVAFASPFTPD